MDRGLFSLAARDGKLPPAHFIHLKAPKLLTAEKLRPSGRQRLHELCVSKDRHDDPRPRRFHSEKVCCALQHLRRSLGTLFSQICRLRIAHCCHLPPYAFTARCRISEEPLPHADSAYSPSQFSTSWRVMGDTAAFERRLSSPICQSPSALRTMESVARSGFSTR